MASKEVAEFFDSYSDRFNAIYGNKNSLFNGSMNRLFRKEHAPAFRVYVARLPAN